MTVAGPMRTRLATSVAILGALSFLLMFLEVATPFAPFLRYDPSDIAALVGGFTLGPIPGAVIVVLRNLLRGLLVKPDPIGLGMNTVAGVAMVTVSAWWYQSRLTRRAAAEALVLGGIAQVLVCIPAAAIAMPLYGLPPAGVPALLWGAIVPFNLVKCTVSGGLTFVFYKRVAPWLPRLRPAAPAGKRP